MHKNLLRPKVSFCFCASGWRKYCSRVGGRIFFTLWICFGFNKTEFHFVSLVPRPFWRCEIFVPFFILKYKKQCFFFFWGFPLYLRQFFSFCSFAKWLTAEIKNFHPRCLTVFWIRLLVWFVLLLTFLMEMRKWRLGVVLYFSRQSQHSFIQSILKSKVSLKR